MVAWTLLVALLPMPGLAATVSPSAAAAPPAQVGFDLLDLIRSLMRNGPRRDQTASKGMKLEATNGRRRAMLRLVEEPRAGIVMLVTLQPSGRDLLAHTARLMIPGSDGAADDVRELSIQRLEIPKESSDREVIVVLLEPRDLDALADAPAGSKLAFIGWEETFEALLDDKARAQIDKFRDKVGSGLIG